MVTVHEIKQIHSLFVTEFPETTTSGIKSEGQLSFIVDTLNGNLPPELHTAFEKAGFLLTRIIQSHPFVDANKRTGLCSAISVLAMEGYTVTYTHDIRCFVKEVARTPTLTYTDVAEKLQTKADPINTTPKDVVTAAKSEIQTHHEIYQVLATE